MSDKSKKTPDHDFGLNAIYLCIAGAIILWAWKKTALFYLHHPIKCYLILSVVLAIIMSVIYAYGRNTWIGNKAKDVIYGDPKWDFLLGVDILSGKKIYLSDFERLRHTQVLGTTGTGKTHYFVNPLIEHDIKRLNGCMVVDGKSENSFSNSIRRFVLESERSDFVTLSMVNPKHSGTYNPFFWGGADFITERFFSAFTFEKEHYRNLQFKTLKTVLLGFEKLGEIPTAALIERHLQSINSFKSFRDRVKKADNDLGTKLSAILGDEKNYLENHSGLLSCLSNLSTGEVASTILNSTTPTIRIESIFKERKVFYVQIPTLQFQTIGPAIGRMLLLEFMQVASLSQGIGDSPETLMSVVLDDFNDFIFKSFGSMLNKIRSANVAVVFSHQSLGDLDRVDDQFRDIVMTNTNVKVILKTPDPISAESLAQFMGTKESQASTERVTSGLFGSKVATGDLSVRTTEEFRFHPNLIKSDLCTGEAIILKPLDEGTKCFRVKLATSNERRRNDER